MWLILYLIDKTERTFQDVTNLTHTLHTFYENEILSNRYFFEIKLYKIANTVQFLLPIRFSTRRPRGTSKEASDCARDLHRQVQQIRGHNS